jgi:adenylyltransferase/sulfurtransferase
MQANEVIKVITGVGTPLSGRLFLFDALNFETRTFNIKRRADNPLNGENPSITQLIDYEFFCGLKNPDEKPIKEITVETFLKWQALGEPYQLIDVREPNEYETANIGGLLLPLGTVTEHADQLRRDVKVVVHCRSGVRSAKAIRALEAQYGLDNLYNLKGGILAYQEQVQEV